MALPCRLASLTYALCSEPAGLSAAPAQSLFGPVSGPPPLTSLRLPRSLLPLAQPIKPLPPSRLSSALSHLMSPSLTDTASVTLPSSAVP